MKANVTYPRFTPFNFELHGTSFMVIISCVYNLDFYGLDDRGSRVRFPAGDGNFSLHCRVQNGSGARPVSYPTGTRGSVPGCKAAGA
jgi:hypothetical protein